MASTKEYQHKIILEHLGKWTFCQFSKSKLTNFIAFRKILSEKQNKIYVLFPVSVTLILYLANFKCRQNKKKLISKRFKVHLICTKTYQVSVKLTGNYDADR